MYSECKYWQVRTGRILAILLFLLIVGAIIVAFDLRYPAEWDLIHLGMPRSEVEALIGHDPGEMVGLGMAYWNDDGILIRNQLQVYMDPYDGTTIIEITRLSKYPIEHRLWTVRDEYLPHENRKPRPPLPANMFSN